MLARSVWAMLLILSAQIFMGSIAAAQCGTVSVIPALVPTAGGTVVDITLSESSPFPIQQVLWNGVPAQFQQISGNRLLVTSRPGQGQPTLVLSYGFSSCELFSSLRYLPPFINSFTPARVLPGGVVTLQGSNFGLTPVVMVGGSPVATTVVTSHSSVSFALPPGESGSYPVVLAVAGQQSNPVFIELVSPPSLDSWIATRRSTGGGDIIVATGSDFGTSPALAFGGVNAQIVRSSDTEIIALIPAGAGADNDLFVWNAGIPGNILNFDYFRPQVSGVSPGRVNAGEQSELVIHGRNLWSPGVPPVVIIGDVVAPIIEAREDRITVVVPALQAGETPVSVTLAQQTSPMTPDSVLEVVVGCPGDTNGDGVVNFTDLNAVLAVFGQACSALLH